MLFSSPSLVALLLCSVEVADDEVVWLTEAAVGEVRFTLASGVAEWLAAAAVGVDWPVISLYAVVWPVLYAVVWLSVVVVAEG